MTPATKPLRLPTLTRTRLPVHAAALARPLTPTEGVAVRYRWDTARERARRPSGFYWFTDPIPAAEMEALKARFEAAIGGPVRWLPSEPSAYVWTRQDGQRLVLDPREVQAVIPGTSPVAPRPSWWRRAWRIGR